MKHTHVLPEALWPVADAIATRPVGTPPDPWRLIGNVAVGGLVAVGFASSSERLLIVGSSGQTIVDCTTGHRLFRDRERDGYCAETLSARGLDQSSSEEIRMCGLHGGALRSVTTDGWSACALAIEWPRQFFILNHPGSDVFMTKLGRAPEFSVLSSDYEARAFGFSWTGRTLILADGSGITIWGRP